jgi:hypothetical protein
LYYKRHCLSLFGPRPVVAEVAVAVDEVGLAEADEEEAEAEVLAVVRLKEPVAVPWQRLQ